MTQPALFDTEADAPVHEPPAPRAGKVKRTVRPLPDGFGDGARASAGCPALMREHGAAELRAIVADFRAGTATGDELMRFVSGSVYLLSAAELVAAANRLADTLGGQPCEST